MRTCPAAGPVVLGVLYPTAGFGPPETFAAAMAEVAAIDPRIEIVVEPYVEGPHLRALRGQPDKLPEARTLAPPLSDAQVAVLARVHAVVAVDLPFDVGSLAPNLAWVQGVGSGYANLESAGLADAGIRCTNGAGASAAAIAEFVVGRVLQHRKRFRELDASQQEHRWEPIFGSELAGATVGLIGLGAINAAVARRLAAFDVRITATRRSARPGDTAPEIDTLLPAARLRDLLGTSEIVIAAVPETADTTSLMDRAAFAAMPPGSFFVNVGRGTLVDEGALIDALVRGHLAGAALDVASIEPLPPAHPLWDAPNLYLSYHCATAPSALLANLHRLWAGNVRRWLAGAPLLNEVVVTPSAPGT